MTGPTDARHLRLIAGWPHMNRARRRAVSLTWRPVPCTCNTLHNHCRVPCRCVRHRGEVGAP